jgi:5-epi-alpha-selinene synthase
MHDRSIASERPWAELLREKQSTEDLIWSTIYCPFSVELNAHIDAVMRHTEDWLLEAGLFASRASCQQFHRMKLHWLASSIYPDCDAEHLALASDWIIISTIWDDLCGQVDVRTHRDELERHTEHIARVLHGQDDACAGDIPYVRTLSALRDRTIPRVSDRLYRRLARDFDAFIRGCATELLNTSAGIVLDIESHIQLRRDTGLTYPMMALIELAYQIELPPELLVHPHLDTMMRMVCNHVNTINDLFSLHAELLENDSHNMVLVWHRQGLPLERAVRQTVEYCNACIKVFMHGEAGLPSFGDALDAVIRRYVAGLRSFLSGHLRWYAQTERYQLEPPGGEADPGVSSRTGRAADRG